jgi:hypothetical protein
MEKLQKCKRTLGKIVELHVVFYISYKRFIFLKCMLIPLAFLYIGK